jgi:hypothetical protein
LKRIPTKIDFKYHDHQVLGHFVNFPLANPQKINEGKRNKQGKKIGK